MPRAPSMLFPGAQRLMELRSERKMEKAASKAHRLPSRYSQVVTAAPPSAFRAWRMAHWASTGRHHILRHSSVLEGGIFIPGHAGGVAERSKATHVRALYGQPYRRFESFPLRHSRPRPDGRGRTDIVGVACQRCAALCAGVVNAKIART
jgi:hypothetical protein